MDSKNMIAFTAPVSDPWVPTDGSLLELSTLLSTDIQSQLENQMYETARTVHSAYAFVKNEHPEFNFHIQACIEKQFFLISCSVHDKNELSCKSTSRAMFLMEHFLIHDAPRLNRAKSVALQTYLTLYRFLRDFKAKPSIPGEVKEDLDRSTLMPVTVGKDIA